MHIFSSFEANGGRGRALMQDYQLAEKCTRQNREHIFERVVHAKKVGRFWVFQSGQ